MTRDEALDLVFFDACSKLIDLAVFLDRVERCPGEDDFLLPFMGREYHQTSSETEV